MAEYCRIHHETSGTVLVDRARWCNTFLTRLRGFSLRRDLAPGEGLVLVETTSIHMMFVFIDLGVLWVNEAGIVVDTAHARPWRPYYAPRAPARYVVEAAPDVLSHVNPGDKVRFERLPMDGVQSS